MSEEVPRASARASLADYQRKRDFGETPEPAGEPTPRTQPDDAGRFVIHQHDATRLHWDLRLEHDGVLASWAIPKCLPRTPERNHLAVHTEDHPIEYLEFEGSIPEGNYGAGRMVVWDRGTYEAIEWRDDKAVIELHGTRTESRYALFAWKGRDWMIHRMDPPEPGWVDAPDDLRPMRGRRGKLPRGGDWVHEVCWPGRRVLLRCEPGDVVIVDRDGRDLSTGFPDVRRVGRALGSTSVVLDGVIVLLDADGLPTADEARLDERAAAEGAKARRLADRHPAAVMIFDVPWFEGRPVTEGYGDRRDLLAGLGLAGPAWQTPAFHEGDGRPFFAAAVERGLPGIVSKRVESPYRPGVVSADWRLVVGDGP